MGTRTIDNIKHSDDIFIGQSETPMNVNETSKYLDVSKSYLYKLTHRMEIPHHKPTGKKIYFFKSELNEWVRRNPIKTINDLDKAAEKY